ncbi:17125_t:CDS:2 [Entrophospora sp. SA101]|nr:17125_t:CDS:2 [Entrophospora sp. SA101]
MFVCCGLPFSLVENPFFIEFVNQLKPAYKLPSRFKLSKDFINEEVANVNVKVELELKRQNNITLGRGLKRGQFRNITTIAAKLWQDFGNGAESCSELLCQLRKYKLHESPYDSPYSKLDNPINWWSTCEDDYNHLQRLAIKLFSVTPHTASAERTFSILRWFYGQRRSRLSTTTIENLAKIHSYYVSNAKKEFNYYGKDITERETTLNCIFENAIINEGTQERRVETMNYLAEDIVQEFLAEFEDT